MSSLKLKFQVVQRQLWNCWSLSGLILLPLHYYNQLIYWKKRGLDSYLSPYESFLQTISVACMWKSLATLCLHLYERSKPTRGLLGFHYNGKPAVIVNDPIVIQRILTEDSNNFENLWQPNARMNPILYKCPMFCTNLNWMRSDVWTQERLDRAFHKLLALKMMTVYKSSFHLLMNQSHQLTVDLREMCGVFAQQVFVRVGLGLTALVDQDVKDGGVIFQKIMDAFEAKTTEPRETLYYLASNLASNDRMVEIVPRNTECDIRRIVRRILSRNDDKPGARQCFLHWLNDDGVNLDDIIHHLFAFCFDLYVHLVCLGSFALRELAEDGSLQNRLCEALDAQEDRDGGKWLARSILGLPILHQFVKEVKRRYPVNGCIARICKAPTVVPVAPDSDKSIELQPGDLVFASTLGMTSDYDNLDLTYVNPNADILKVALIMLVATNLRCSRLGPGNQKIEDVKVSYEAILPENVCTLRAALRPHRIREVIIP